MFCEIGREKAVLLPKQEDLTAGVCPVDWAKRCVDIARSESCGISVMCRDGMAQLQAIIQDIVTGQGMAADLPLLEDICTVIEASGSCSLAAQAAKQVLYSLREYADDWNQHCLRKRCASLVCSAYYSLYIDPERCTGCGNCKKAAPEGTIEGDEGLIHIIRNDSPLKAMKEFETVCPANAIQKAGALKPRLPQQPVPVGSFHSRRGRGRGVIITE